MNISTSSFFGCEISCWCKRGPTRGVANLRHHRAPKAQADGRCPVPGIARALGEVDRARARLKANANFRLTVDVMLTNVQRSLVS